jgi:hypothetical protein
MALPTKLVAWNYQLLTRITYTSLVQVAREVMFTIKERLKAQGWTVKGSCDGTTGAMDAVDRWAAATDAGTRFNGIGGAQSWFVLIDGNGANILFSYNSAADDVYEIAVDLAGNYVVAGTPANRPTSTTEQSLNKYFISTPGTIIGTGASGDRLVSIWTRPDFKGFRVAIARSGAWQSQFGVDQHAAVAHGAGITVSPNNGFYVNGGLDSANHERAGVTSVTAAGQRRVVVRTNLGAFNAECSWTTECGAATSAVDSSFTQGTTFAPELQGGVEYVMKRIGAYSITAGMRGKAANLLDWWYGRSAIADGDTYGNREFIVINGSCGLIWPWDGTPSIAGTPVVMT